MSTVYLVESFPKMLLSLLHTVFLQPMLALQAVSLPLQPMIWSTVPPIIQAESSLTLLRAMLSGLKPVALVALSSAPQSTLQQVLLFLLLESSSLQPVLSSTLLKLVSSGLLPALLALRAM